MLLRKMFERNEMKIFRFLIFYLTESQTKVHLIIEKIYKY